jgi:hypothetical protein
MDAVDHLGRSLRIKNHAFCLFPDLLDVRLGRIQPLQTGLATYNDGSERLFDLVRDRRG